MKVILKEDVKALGKKGTLCSVSDGYARNFLLPKGLAMEASKHNLEVMNSKNKAKAAQEEREHDRAENIADRINSMVLTINAEAGESGKLFGAITNKDISLALKEKFKLDIDKKKIENITIKNLEEKDVSIKLYKGISASLKVRVEKKTEGEV